MRTRPQVFQRLELPEVWRRARRRERRLFFLLAAAIVLLTAALWFLLATTLAEALGYVGATMPLTPGR